MKSRFVSLVAVVFAAALPFVSGCAEDDYEMREAAYPQPIGYSTPPSQPPAQSAAVETPASPAPAPLEAPGAAGQGAQFAPATSQEVVIGDADAPAADDYADTDPSALTDFRSTLDPYGTWADDPTYGTVWVPSSSVVGADFTPYVTAGHWVYDDDYVWVSDYDWGWAPFHYGRWAWVGGVGWEWIPGREYAGAWVSWRYGWDDWAYVGWAPLGPTWCWHGGVAVGVGFVPAAPYAFVGTGELFAPSIGSRVVAGSQVGVIAAHTRPYVPASPSVNGRVAATPRVGGPPPASLHIPAAAIAHGAMTNRGIMQAHAFARPSSALAMGARAPQGYASTHVGAVGRGAVGGGVAMGRAPAYGPPAASHFGGRLGAGFRGSIGSAAPSYGYRPPAYSMGSHPYSGGAPPSSGGAPRYSAPAASGYPGYHGSYAGGGFRSAPSFGAPSVGGHAPVAPSGGSRHGGGYSEGGVGGFHGGGFRGGGGFHGGGGGGGGRGGGGHR